MKAIQTHYLGPTGRRGSAIKAFTVDHKLTTPYEHEFSVEWNHRTAAVELAEQMGWPEPLLMGLEGAVLPNGDYAWIEPMRRRPATTTEVKE